MVESSQDCGDGFCEFEVPVLQGGLGSVALTNLRCRKVDTTVAFKSGRSARIMARWPGGITSGSPTNEELPTSLRRQDNASVRETASYFGGGRLFLRLIFGADGGIHPRFPQQNASTCNMGQQHNKVLKRKRRKQYLKRKRELDLSKRKLSGATRKDSDS